MNPSERVSSASPSPTSQIWYKSKRELSHRPSTFRHHHNHRSRSYSASPPPPPQRRSLSRHRSPRAFTKTRPMPRRSRSRSRRRHSPAPSYRSTADAADRVEQYHSICIKNLNDKIDSDHLYDSIYLEFKRYGTFTIKIVFNKKSGSHSRSERIAFVNFDDHRTALEAKREKNHKVLCGLPMYIEPVYKNYNAGGQGHLRRSRSASRGRVPRRSASRPRGRDPQRRPSPYDRQRRVRTPPAPPARLKYDDLANRLSSPKRPRAPQPLMKSPAAPPPPSLAVNSSAMHYFDDDDKDQTRTLFIGNLDADTQRDYLWKQFERYGTLEEIDIKKNLPAGHADYAKKTYAFVRYENMDMAKEAKMRMNAKRIGQSEIKIGYGKVQATNCLWIGGLRDSANIRDLEKKIQNILNTNDSTKYDILYTSPNNYAFVLFYNVTHAEEVRHELRNKNLPRSDKLRIDFHDPKKFNLLQPKLKKSRSPASPPKRRLVQPDQPAPEDDTAETKSKKSKMPNGADTKPNYENIIITKIDNVRRVDAVGSKNRSRSRSRPRSRPRSGPASPVPPKKKRSSSPNGHKNGEGQADKREFELGKLKDEAETAVRHVIKPSWLLDESHVHLSRSVMTKSIKSVADMKTLLEPYSNWSGQLTLKKNSFPVKFYLMAGNKQLSESFLPALNTDMNLHINQRIRLDSSKLEDIEKRLSERFDNDESVTYSVFVCVATELTKSDQSVLHKRSLHNLVSYLNQKSAAGVVNLPDDARVHANLNIFTASSNLSSKVFKQLLAGFRLEQLSEEQDSFLVCVLLKAGSA